MLPKTLGGRIMLALLTLVLLPPSGILAFVLFFVAEPEPDVTGQIVMAICADFLLVLFAVCVLGFVWALFAPPRMERLAESVSRHLLRVFWVMFVATAVVSIRF
jgi:hypothetical protein